MGHTTSIFPGMCVFSSHRMTRRTRSSHPKPKWRDSQGRNLKEGKPAQVYHDRAPSEVVFLRALDKSKERDDDKRELNNRPTHTPPDAHSLLIVHRPLLAAGPYHSLLTAPSSRSRSGLSTTPHAPQYASHHPTPFDNVLNRWNFEISESDGRLFTGFTVTPRKADNIRPSVPPTMEFTLTTYGCLIRGSRLLTASLTAISGAPGGAQVPEPWVGRRMSGYMASRQN